MSEKTNVTSEHSAEDIQIAYSLKIALIGGLITTL